MALLQFVLSLFAPPVAVFLKVGLGTQFWVNLLLTALFFVPGVIHAIFFVDDRGAVTA